MFNTDNKLTILAIGAHGDDIELACGGSLAKAISKGHQVIMVVVTGKDSKDHKNVSIRDNGSAEKEAKAAAKILGVSVAVPAVEQITYYAYAQQVFIETATTVAGVDGTANTMVKISASSTILGDI